MSRLVNTVQLIGNTGNDVEYKQLENGREYAKVSLATNESYKNSDGEKITKTEWHNLVVWGKRAKAFSKYLKKGHKIAVEGKLTTNKYTNDSGVTFYNTVIEVREFEFLTPKS